MLDAELIKDGILAILEEKASKIKPGIESLIWLSKRKDLDIGNSILGTIAGFNDITAALQQIEEETNGRFKRIKSPPPLDYWGKEPASVINPEKPDIVLTVEFKDIAYRKKRKGTGNKTDTFHTFWLTPTELYTDIAGEKCSIQLKSKGVTYRLLLALSENPSSQLGTEIAANINTTKRTFEVEVGKLRKKAERAFPLKGNEFIEGSPNGYKLGARVKIKSKDR
jgi:hypothetical protein